MISCKASQNISEFNDFKQLLLTHIISAPGIRYRELLRLTGLSNGVLSYHLGALEKSYQIRVVRQRDNRTTRYYSVSIPDKDSEILGQLRNSVAKEIITFILEHDLCTFVEIVEHLRKAPSTISWHLKRLKEAGVIYVKYGQEYQLYQILNSELVADVLYKYKESLVDKVVNNYTQMVDEL